MTAGCGSGARASGRRRSTIHLARAWFACPTECPPGSSPPSWRLEEAHPRLRRHAPLFGEHNREILCGLLGHAEAELAELEAAGVIGYAPVNPGIG
jgi:crotonobetainyl-CoA:carnitine CoA-transferase CaiB-like acyl-CoA transferase